MEEARKSFYSIPEAARLKGVSEEELLGGIRDGLIPSRRVGLRQMVPAAGVFEGPAKEAITERGKKYLEQMRADLLKALEAAPEYGSCGIIVTFHAGLIVKVTTHSEITKLKDQGRCEQE